MDLNKAYVVSDLHLGGGEADPELEDFHQDREFAAFVGGIGPGETLFLNGDLIDFPQIPPYDTPAARHLLWTEAASRKKVDQSIKAHPAFFEALRKLVARGGRVRILVGNHDLDLVWPSVQDSITQAIAPPLGDPAALRFSMDAEVYAGVHIEHGHAFTPENCPADPSHFIHEVDEKGTLVRYLERVWGTDFMLDFYNDLERQYRFADNVKPMLKIVYYGLRRKFLRAKHVVRLLVFLKRRGLPWRGIGSSLDGEMVTPATVMNSVEAEWYEAVRDRLDDPAFEKEMVETIASLDREERRVLAAPVTVQLPGPTARDEADTARDGTLGLFREDRELRAAGDRLNRAGVTHVVFGHTHDIVDGALDGRLYNPGTWLPHLNLNDAAVKQRIKDEGLTLEMLKDETLYTTVRTVVEIAPDAKGGVEVRLIRV